MSNFSKQLILMLKSNVKNYMLIFLLLFAPALKLAHFNYEYFAISYIELVIFIAAIAAVVWVPVALIRMSRRLIPYIDMLIAFVFITSIISTFFLPVSLGVIDGGSTFVLEKRGEALIFSMIMFALYLLAIVFIKWGSINQYIYKIVRAVTFGGVAYVLLFSVYAAVIYPKLIGFTGQGINVTYAPVSSERNIFVISFDQIQGSFLYGYLNKYPDKKAVFDNFVFYPDAASTYPNTMYSIASTLLGRIVSGSTESPTYSIGSRESITRIMQAHGYNVLKNNYPRSNDFPSVLHDERNTAFNFFKSYENFMHAMNLAFGIDIRSIGISLPRSLSGHMPPDLTNQAWHIDLHNFKDVISAMKISNTKPTLYFMHFLGTHQPFLYNSDCSLRESCEIEKSQNIEGATAAVDCIISLLDQFIRKLKDMDVYDKSMIFFISDHGYERNINKFMHTKDGKIFFGNASDAVGDRPNSKPVGSYNPVLLFKDFKSADVFRVEMLPASLVDIAPTICASAGLDCWRKFEGQVLQNLKDEPRERFFWFFYGGTVESRRKEGGRPLHFTRSLKELEKWWEVRSFKGPIYPNLAFAMGLSEEDYKGSYSIGDKVSFARDGNSERHVRFGWSGEELNHRWTEGSQAGLMFRLQDQQSNNLLLRLKARAYLGGGRSYQTVSVVVNERKVATWQMKGWDWYEAVIPSDFVGKDGLLKVVFNISSPAAPCEVSASKDCRKLGINVRELVITHKHDNS